MSYSVGTCDLQSHRPIADNSSDLFTRCNSAPRVYVHRTSHGAHHVHVGWQTAACPFYPSHWTVVENEFHFITTANQGLLCCHQSLSATDCVLIQVLERTLAPKLYVSLKNITLDRKGDGSVSSTLTAVVQCTLVALRMADITSGFMSLRVNELSSILIYDPYPQLQANTNTIGVPTWSLIHRYAVTIRDGDTLGCQWNGQELQDSLTADAKVDLSLPDSPTNIATTFPVSKTVASLRVVPPWGWYVDNRNRDRPIYFQCLGGGARVMWLHNGKDIGAVSPCNSGGTRTVCGPILHITSFQIKYAGLYTCRDPLTRREVHVPLGRKCL